MRGDVRVNDLLDDARLTDRSRKRVASIDGSSGRESKEMWVEKGMVVLPQVDGVLLATPVVLPVEYSGNAVQL
jgi:hypothetical protein